MYISPTLNGVEPASSRAGFDQHICEILRALWICCTVKVILAYKPTTVKPICKIKTMSLYNRCGVFKNRIWIHLNLCGHAYLKGNDTELLKLDNETFN